MLIRLVRREENHAKHAQHEAGAHANQQSIENFHAPLKEVEAKVAMLRIQQGKAKLKHKP